MLLCVCACMHNSVCPATDVQVCMDICCPYEPAYTCPQPLPLYPMVPSGTAGLTSNQELPHLGIVADNYRD